MPAKNGQVNRVGLRDQVGCKYKKQPWGWRKWHRGKGEGRPSPQHASPMNRAGARAGDGLTSMSNINSIQNVSVPAIAPVAPPAAGAAPVQASAVTDVVEISTVARLAAKIQELPEVRTELIQRVKAEIAAGTYETPERLDIAVNRLMDELTGTL